MTITIAVVIGRFGRRSGRKHPEQLPAALELSRAMAVAEEAVVADAMKSVRQYMDQKAANVRNRTLPLSMDKRRLLEMATRWV
jgi:hypothetical protein